MIVKNETEKTNLIEAGRRLAVVLGAIQAKVAPGVSAEELDNLAEHLIRERGDEPCFLGYTPDDAKRPYPATLCVSINDEVVHGIPNESVKIFKEGDIVGLDLGLRHQGIVVDAAVTVPVGSVDDRSKKLLYATENALIAGIAQAIPGNHIGDVSHSIQKVIENSSFTVVKELGGHGVGNLVHEEPFIPNFGRAGEGELIEEGMEFMGARARLRVSLKAKGRFVDVRDAGNRSIEERFVGDL